MSDSEVFREVDEELRREQYKKLWDKYGTLVLALAGLIVIGVAGYKGWQYFQTERSTRFGSSFTGALDLLNDKKNDEAILQFDQMAKDAPTGYRSLARLQLAALAAQQGRTAEAQASYDALAVDPTVDRPLQNFARVRAAAVMIDTASFTDMQNRLNDFLAIDSPWRHTARELLGLSAWKAGKLDEAEKMFSAVIADQGAPRGIRKRAEIMLSLIVAALAKPATG